MMAFSKNTLNFTEISLKNEFHSPAIYLVGITTFVLIQYCFGGISEFLSLNNDRMNIFEIYVFFMSSRISQIIYFVSVVILSCGVMYFSAGAAYYLIRSNRFTWILSQIIYSFIIVLIINLTIFISLIVCCKSNVTFDNIWSETTLYACQFSPNEIGIMPIIFFDYIITQIPPYSAGMLTFLLSFLIGVFISLIMVISNVMNKNVVGIASLLLIWFLDYLIDNSTLDFVFTFISPFGLSRLGRSLSQGGNLFLSVIILVVAVIVTIYFLFRESKKVDFIKME